MAPTQTPAGRRKRDSDGRIVERSLKKADASKLSFTKADSSKVSFLDLAGELRNKVYRYSMVGEKRIILAGKKCKQPSLLLVNRQIRDEASSIYYTENSFRFDIKDMAGAAMVPFRTLLVKHRRQTAPSQNFFYHIRGGISWENLFAWLKAYHQTPRLAPRLHVGKQRRNKVVLAAFNIVDGMRGDGWGKMEAVLEAFHDAISAQEYAWA